MTKKKNQIDILYETLGEIAKRNVKPDEETLKHLRTRLSNDNITNLLNKNSNNQKFDEDERKVLRLALNELLAYREFTNSLYDLLEDSPFDVYDTSDVLERKK